MKIMFMALIGFSLGAAGGVFMAARQPAVVDPTMPSPDSVEIEIPPDTQDSGAVPVEGDTLELESNLDSILPPANLVVVPDSSGATVPALAVVPPPPDVPDEPAGPTQEEIVAAQQSVARILGTMKPNEAALVIAGLSDDEAESVIRNLGTRKAALLLAKLPRERAALLARRLMIPQGDPS